MVAHVMSCADVDRIFRALADTTRRDILRRTVRGEVSVSTLASYYDMSFAAVQKHVAVLQAAGLVSKLPRGRERLVTAEPEPLALVRALLTQLEGLWRERGQQLDDLFAEPAANAASPPILKE
jgi:DNA-binding transcriptional ArsR family regulator